MIASPRRGMANNLIIIFILIIHSAAVAMAAEKSNHQHSAGRTAEKRPTTRKRGRPHYGSIMLTTRLRCATPFLTVKNALEIARARVGCQAKQMFSNACAQYTPPPPICNDDVVSACHAVSGALLLMMMSVRVTMCEFWNAFK